MPIASKRGAASKKCSFDSTTGWSRQICKMIKSKINAASTTNKSAHRRSVQLNVMAIYPPTSPMMKMGTANRWGNPYRHSPRPSQAPNAALLPLMLATNRPAKMIKPTASTKPAIVVKAYASVLISVEVDGFKFFFLFCARKSWHLWPLSKF